jgi:hypothetical protein
VYFVFGPSASNLSGMLQGFANILARQAVLVRNFRSTNGEQRMSPR